MNDRAQSSFAFDDGVRDTHFSAESGKEDDKFDRVDIIRNQNKRSFLVLNQANNVVQSEFDRVWLLADVFLLLALFAFTTEP